MAGNDLRILITANLNIGKSIGDINAAIKGLEKKINAIKLNIEIDDKVSKTLANFSKAMENHKKITQDLNAAYKEQQTIVKKANGITEKTTLQYKKNGEIFERTTKIINEQTQATKKQGEETGKLIDQIDKLGRKQKEITKMDGQGNITGGSVNYGDKFKSTTSNYDKNNQVTSQRTVENIRQQEEAMEKLRQKVLQLNNAGTITASSLSRMTNAINGSKTEAELNRVAQVLNRVQNSANAREQTRELEHQVRLYQQQAQINAQNLRRRYGNSIGDDGQRALNNYLASVNRLSAVTPNVRQQMQQLNMSFREVSANVNSASSHVMSFGQQLQIAMSRIPIWMTGMTAFYLPLRGMQDALRQIVEIDSQLTVLERVSNGQIDINQTMQESIELATQLGNTIKEVNEGFIAFARQGFRGEELNMMAEYATLLGNISDMSVEESASTITAAVKGLNLEVEESLHVINALNEVDNNFAITTQNLSSALMKSAGAANTYGVSLENTIGYTTAIGQVTRESGSIIGNSLKSIYSRITSIQPAIDAMAQIGVNIRDSSGEMLKVDDILANLAKEWKNLSSEQQQNLGLQIAGRYQLSRFLILMDQFGEAQKASATALKSENSAYRENEKYLESYQAKLNQLSNSWTELSTVMGEEVLGSGIVVVSQSLTGIANATSFVVDKVGLLAPLLGIASAAFLALNSGTRNAIMQQGLLSTSLVRTGDSMSIAAGRSRALQAQLYNLTLASRAAGTSIGVMGSALKGIFTFLSRAALPIAGFMLLGTAISSVTNKIVEQQQKNKDLKKQQDDIRKSYSSNSEEIHRLANEYEILSSKAKSNPLVASSKEYIEVQNELGKLMPVLVASEDERGNKHLRTTEAVKQELEYAEQLKDNYAKMSLENFEDDIEDRGKKAQNLVKEIERLKNATESGYASKSDSASLEAQRELIATERELQLLLSDSKNYLDEKVNALLDASGASAGLTDSNRELIKSFIEQKVAQEGSITSGKDYEKFLRDISNEAVTLGENLASVPDQLSGLFSAKQASSFSDNQVGVLSSISEQLKSGYKDWDSYRNVLEQVGFSQTQSSRIIYNLKNNQGELGKEVKKTAVFFDEYADEVFNAADAEAEKLTTTERLVGVSEKQVDSIYEMIGTYQLLSQMEELSAEQKEILANATSFLASVYPDLVNGSEANIEMMKQEIESTDVLRQAIDLMAKGEVSAQDAMTISTAIGTKNRLNLLRKEIQAYNEFFRQANDNANTLESEKLAMRKLPQIQVDIDSLTSDLDKYTTRLSDSLDINGRYTESLKKNNKEYENSTYVSDKFKQALEKINLELEKQQAIQGKFPKHSKEYQKALKKELELLKEKKKLLEGQAKSLDAQIKSGKIQQTGLIKTKGVSASSVSYSGKYANEINQASSKYGVDPYLIAAIIQAESSFNPNARSHVGAQGLMQLMPATARELGVKNAYVPLENIMGGTKYIAQQIEKFGGDIKKALWAYNAGAGNVSKILNSGSNSWLGVKAYADKILSTFNATNKTVSTSSNSVADYYAKNFRVTSTFGQQESFRSSPHKGLDLANGRQGDPVKALSGGKVITATYSKSAGYWVVVQQDDGTVAKYMHMQKGLNVKAGQRIEAGQQLGKVGNTGQSTGAHLHIQIEQNGKAIDPQSYLSNLSSSTGEVIAEQLQSIDEAKSDLTQLKGDISAINQQIEEIRHNIIMSYVEQYDYQVNLQDTIAKRLELSTYNMSKSSQGFRNELKKQRDALIEKQKLIAEEEKQIRHLMATTQMTERTRAELRAKLDELYEMRYENAEARDAKTWEIVNSLMEEHAEVIDDINEKLEDNQRLQGYVNKNSKEYIDLLKEEVSLIEDKRKAILEEVNALNLQMYTQNLTKEQMKELQNAIDDLLDESASLGDSIKTIHERMVGDAIDVLKRGYETERDLRTNAIDKEIDDLEEAHRKKLDMYDEDLKAYEKVINAKLRLIDDQYSEDTYNKELGKLQEEEGKIRQRISVLSLDDSQEAQAKRIQLEEQLRDIQEQIEQKKYDRTIDLRKQNLKDELDGYQEGIENQKDVEDEKFENTKESLEKTREEIERHYNEILANERFWENLRLEMLNGNISKMEGKLQEFLKNFKGYNQDMIYELGMSWSELQNMINSILSQQSMVPMIPSTGKDAQQGDLGQNSGEKIEAWNKYLSNKRKYSNATSSDERQKLAKENNALRQQYNFVDGHWDVLENLDITKVTSPSAELSQKLNDWYMYLHNKKVYDDSSPEARKKLATENDRLRKKWGFPDGHWTELEKMKIYHEGGVVGNKGSKLANLINTIANGTKPNEQIIKALKGEVMIPEKNLPNFLQNIGRMFTPDFSGMRFQPATAGGVEVNINIDNFNGTNREINTLENRLVNTLKNLGKI